MEYFLVLGVSFSVLVVLVIENWVLRCTLVSVGLLVNLIVFLLKNPPQWLIRTHFDLVKKLVMALQLQCLAIYSVLFTISDYSLFERRSTIYSDVFAYEIPMSSGISVCVLVALVMILESLLFAAGKSSYLSDPALKPILASSVNALLLTSSIILFFSVSNSFLAIIICLPMFLLYKPQAKSFLELTRSNTGTYLSSLSTVLTFLAARRLLFYPLIVTPTQTKAFTHLLNIDKTSPFAAIVYSYLDLPQAYPSGLPVYLIELSLWFSLIFPLSFPPSSNFLKVGVI